MAVTLRISLTPYGEDAERLDRIEAELAARLGSQELARHLAAGAAMRPDDAVDHARAAIARSLRRRP